MLHLMFLDLGELLLKISVKSRRLSAEKVPPQSVRKLFDECRASCAPARMRMG